MSIELRCRDDNDWTRLWQRFQSDSYDRGRVPQDLHYLVLCLARYIVAATPGPIRWQQEAWQRNLACVDLLEIKMHGPCHIQDSQSSNRLEAVLKVIRNGLAWYLQKRHDFLGVVLRHGVGTYRVCSEQQVWELDARAKVRQEPAVDEPGISSTQRNSRSMLAVRMWGKWEEIVQVEGMD